MTVVLAEIEHPPSEAPPPGDVGRSNRRWWFLLGVLVIWIGLGWVLQGVATLDLPTAQNTDFQQWLNDVKNSIEQAKFDGNPFFIPIEWISDGISAIVEWLQRLFSTPEFPRPVPEIGWAGVVALAAWVSYALGGVRIAIGVTIGTLALGYLGLWEASIDTLIIVGVSVLLCVAVGLPVGIWMARSHRATTAITPVLDLLQTMPSLAYLAPLALIFGIGIPGAVIVTILYGLPPLVRISAHGLRSVSPTTVEATTALGSTTTQQLTKVQLPMARRTIIVGLNQTIMAALSMATVAALINGPGLGIPITQGLESLNVGMAFVAGFCVVILAIMLDRTSVAAGDRGEVTSRRRVNPQRQRIILGAGAVVVLIAVYLSHTRIAWAKFPESDLGRQLAVRINDWNQWVTDNFRQFTKALGDFVTTWLLLPLSDLLANSPWWLVAGSIMAIAAILGGAGSRRGLQSMLPAGMCILAVTIAGVWASGSVDITWWICWIGIAALISVAVVLGAGGALLPTSICLTILFGVGLWNDSMVTLSMTLVATVIVMVLGVAVGVWMGRGRRVDTLVRPVLDFLQTMPALVYLVPALALFPPGRFLAIMAAVFYAAPVAIKIAADGIRGVSATTVEAAQAAGSNRWQMIAKVQLPMSKGSMVLAANQGLLYVLSMVVIGGLVGGGALGYLVIVGLSQTQSFGKGLAAGIAITALGIMLDRITVHTASRYGRAETT